MPEKKKAFGGYGITVDDNLSKVLDKKKGSKVTPAEMTKFIWAYVKKNKLGGRD